MLFKGIARRSLTWAESGIDQQDFLEAMVAYGYHRYMFVHILGKAKTFQPRASSSVYVQMSPDASYVGEKTRRDLFIFLFFTKPVI